MIKIIITKPCEYVAIKLDNINVGILKIKIIIDEAEFKYLSSNNLFDFKYKKIFWCKCLLSGEDTLFFFNTLLDIENKFSNEGYHKMDAT